MFLGGGARPNARFQALCPLANVRPRTNVETGRDEPWELKDLRKTCATYYDARVPESAVAPFTLKVAILMTARALGAP